MVPNRPLRMTSANIAGFLTVDSSTFTAGAEFSGLRCRGLTLNDATFADEKEPRRPLYIANSRIEGHLDLSGAALPGLELFGATIGGDLRLVASEARVPPKWGKGARLGLRNVRGGGLRDNKDAWPPSLNLLGFVYDRLGGDPLT